LDGCITVLKGGSKMDMSVWFLVGAILVFFMQCGFAMVETGFTRAKTPVTSS
jgi:ammonia channel protein AmtB